MQPRGKKMEINKAAIREFMEFIGKEEQSVVSLFVVSSKNHRLKKLDLAHFTPEKRAEKLHQWGQEQRFVAIIEMGDMVFAYASVEQAKQLQLQEALSLNGKRVTVKALTEEESKQLSIVGETLFEEYRSEKNSQNIKEKERASFEIVDAQRQNLPSKVSVSDRIQMHTLINLIVKNHLSTIITNSWQKYMEAQREWRKQKEADDQSFDIKRNEIKKEILKSEIKQEEINRQEQKRRVLRQETSLSQ